jgi:hypothetical protein
MTIMGLSPATEPLPVQVRSRLIGRDLPWPPLTHRLRSGQSKNSSRNVFRCLKRKRPPNVLSLICPSHREAHVRPLANIAEAPC